MATAFFVALLIFALIVVGIFGEGLAAAGGKMFARSIEQFRYKNAIAVAFFIIVVGLAIAGAFALHWYATR